MPPLFVVKPSSSSSISSSSGGYVSSGSERSVFSGGGKDQQHQHSEPSPPSPPSSPELVPANRNGQLRQPLSSSSSFQSNGGGKHQQGAGSGSSSLPPRMMSGTGLGGASLARPPRSRSNSGGGGLPPPSSPTSSHRPPLIQREGSNGSLSSMGSTGGGGGPEAIVEMERALERAVHYYGSPHHVEVAALLNRLGNLHFRARSYGEAAECYKRAIQCDPGDHLGDAYANLGAVYWTTGQVDKAVPVLQQALATHELEAVASGSSSSSSLSSSGGEQPQNGQQLPLVGTPQVADVHHQLGLAYCLKQEYQKSMECLLKARKIREARGDHLGVAKSFESMGKVLYCQGSLDQALLHHQQALGILRVTKSCNVSNTLKSMSQIYLQKEEWAKALEIFSELLKEQKARFLNAHASRQSVIEPGKALYATMRSAAYCYQRLDANDEANHCLREADNLARDYGLSTDFE